MNLANSLNVNLRKERIRESLRMRLNALQTRARRALSIDRRTGDDLARFVVTTASTDPIRPRLRNFATTGDACAIACAPS
jgi:hypothetical protein